MFRVTVIVAALFALLSQSVAFAADERSTTDRLDARRFVTAGPRAYEVGTRLVHYRAIRDRDVQSVEPLLVMPRPSNTETSPES